MNDVVTPDQIRQQANRVSGNSQATNIEQSRAIAEVQAMVLVAQRAPRDEARAMSQAMSSCSQRAVADRAFFSFSRGGSSVNGESIHLATELARCWGNIDYGIMELARDDVAGHTEMLAFAWDLETNAKSRQTFIVPHVRDTRQGKKPLTDMRDIYENNANNGARRLRECIFRVLPPYLKVAAAQRCREVLEKGEGDQPLPARIATAIERFSKIGISLDRIEAKHGPNGRWTPVELANLQITYQSIRQGETTADEAFPKPGTDDVTNDLKKIAESQKKSGGADTVVKDNPTAAEGPSDEDRGEDHNDEPHPAQAAVDQHLRRIMNAELKADVNMAISDFSAHKANLPDDMRQEVEDAEHNRLMKFSTAGAG